MKIRRRQFLQCLVSVPLMTALPVFAAGRGWQRRLVIVDLDGGNDGLNTVIPFADAAYAQLRPTLAVPADQALRLDQRLGLHPALAPLMPAWDKNELAVALGVGYARPNRSHFRSADIWNTGSGSEQVWDQGWLARLFEQASPPTDFLADGVTLGTRPGPLAGGRRTIVLDDPGGFVRRGARIAALDGEAPNLALEHVLAVREQTRASAQQLAAKLPEIAAAGRTGSDIRKALRLAAELIEAGIPVAAIKVTQGGYDTHNNQGPRHRQLLTELGGALAEFRDRMIAAGEWRDTLVMTLSEFGRRAKENGNRGTDHGTAAPSFVLGGAVRGGLYGEQPDLAALRGNDLAYTLDYRKLYNTVIRDWWGLPAGQAFDGFAPLDMLRT